MSQPQIFISAVSSEFRSLRRSVAEILTRLGYIPVTQEILGTESGDLRQVLREKIDSCAGVVQIVGKAYGFEPPTIDPDFGRVSYTQYELLYARAKGKKTYVIFAGDECQRDTPVELLDLPTDSAHPDPKGYQAERAQLQKDYLGRHITGEHIYYSAGNNAELFLKIEQLRDSLSELRRGEQRWRRHITVSLVVIAILLTVLGGMIWTTQLHLPEKPKGYPITQKEKNDVHEMIGFVVINLTHAESIFSYNATAMKEADHFLENPSDTGYRELTSVFEFARKQIKKQQDLIQPLSEQLRLSLANTPVKVEDLTQLPDLIKLLAMERIDRLDFFQQFLSPQIEFDVKSKREWIQKTISLQEADADGLYYGTCELLLPIRDNELAEFQTKYLPGWQIIASANKPWLRDKTQLESQQERINTRQQFLVNELKSLVQNTDIQLKFKEADLRRQFKDKGWSDQQIKDYFEKANKLQNTREQLSNKKAQLEKSKQDLAEAKERLRVKFAPLPDDSAGILWNKARKFIRVRLYQDAIVAFKMFQEKQRKDDPNADIYVPAAILFASQMEQRQLKSGSIVAGYAPGMKNPHINIGDIIISMDGTAWASTKEMMMNRKAMTSDSCVISILRRREDNTFQSINVEWKKNDPKFAMIDLVTDEE